MLDQTDIAIINCIQEGLPIAMEPFRVLGENIGISEQEIIRRLTRLREAGFIRRIGGIFDSGKLGYTSTLCALQVSEADIEDAAGFINAFPGVTHNYIRNHVYNIWFTVAAPSKSDLNDIVMRIKQRFPKNRLTCFPSKKQFKIRAVFKLEEHDNA